MLDENKSKYMINIEIGIFLLSISIFLFFLGVILFFDHAILVIANVNNNIIGIICIRIIFFSWNERYN